MRDVYGKSVLTTLEEIVRPCHTALIVVDVQNDFVHPDGLGGRRGDLSAVTAMLPVLQRLLAAARSAGVQPIFVQNTNYPDARTSAEGDLARRVKLWGEGEPLSCQVDTWGREFAEGTRPEPDDITVAKYRNCGFTGTNLDMILRAGAMRTIVVTGVATHACVLATALSGMHLGYYVVVPPDCVATTSPKHHEAGLLVVAANLQESAVVPSAAIMDAWAAPAPGGGGINRRTMGGRV